METGKKFFSELDPRMKLLLLIVFTTTTYMSQNMLSLIWNYVLIVALHLVRELWKSAWKTGLLFAFFLILELLINLIPYKGINAALGMIIFFLQRTSVLFVMAAWIANKLRISDFVSSMQNMHIPKGATITLAVVFRYLPTAKEEFYYIKNTMKLRGIDLSLRNILLCPLKTCEYAVVPLVIRSMNISDELAASAMTRGLDLETKRTSYREVRLCLKDIIATALVIAAVAAGLVFTSILQGVL